MPGCRAREQQDVLVDMNSKTEPAAPAAKQQLNSCSDSSSGSGSVPQPTDAVILHLVIGQVLHDALGQQHHVQCLAFRSMHHLIGMRGAAAYCN